MASVIIPVLLVVLLVSLALYRSSRKNRTGKPFLDLNGNDLPKDVEGATLRSLPGPAPLPVIGNLHLLAKYEANPYAGFSELAKQYGRVYQLRMGTTKAVVVNDYEDIMEVLIKKGNLFDGRPNLLRWNWYFAGDRQKCECYVL